MACASPPPHGAPRPAGLDLAALSHEIRTPLNAILGFAQILEMGDLDPRQRRHVEAILGAGASLLEILARRLDAPPQEDAAPRTRPG